MGRGGIGAAVRRVLAARGRDQLVPLSVAVLVLAALWFLTSLVGLTPPTWGTVLMSPAIGISGLACRAAARADGLSRPARRYWNQLALASATVFVGCGLRSYHSITDPDPHVVTFHTLDMAILLFSVCVEAWAMIRLPFGLRSRTQRWAFGLDICTILVAAVLFWWQVVFRSLAIKGDDQGLIVALVAEGAGQVVLFALIKVAMTGSRTLDRGALRLMGVALVFATIFSVPDSFLAAHTGLTATQLVLPIASLFAVLAARRQWRAVAAPPTQERLRPHRAFSVIPYVAVAAIDALLLLSTGYQHRYERLLVAFVVVGITMLVVARQFMTFRENRQLVARLDAGLAELRDHERRFRSLVQNSSDIISITAVGGDFSYVSPGIEAALGLRAEDVLHRPAASIVHPDDMDVVHRQFVGIVDKPGATATYQARLRHADGTWRWMEITMANQVNDPSVRGVVGNARDITQARELQHRLTYQASHDALTKLANRALFAHRVEEVLAVPATAATTAVVLVDLNEFKAVNDSLGHAVGDALLIATADRLVRLGPPGSTIARLGGDEFAVLLIGTTPEQVEELAEQITRAFDPPVPLGDRDIAMAASIGYAYGWAEASPDELLRRADVAMYAAKGGGERRQTRHAGYTQTIDCAFAAQTQLEADLRQAIEDDALYLLFQPIVELGTRRPVAVEALLRWNHPDRGPVSPTTFVPIAERTGLIVPLGRWVLRTACAQAAAWHRRYGDAAPAMSVNVSPLQLRDTGFVDEVAARLSEHGLPPDRLTVEVTESMAVDEPGSRTNLAALHRLGVRVSLDDFGTGHSALSLLDECPVDELKLDRAFTQACTDPARRRVAAAVAGLARSLELDTVAEGVETAAEADELERLGFRFGQGYLFAPAVAPEQVDEMIDAHHGGIAALASPSTIRA